MASQHRLSRTQKKLKCGTRIEDFFKRTKICRALERYFSRTMQKSSVRLSRGQLLNAIKLDSSSQEFKFLKDLAQKQSASSLSLKAGYSLGDQMIVVIRGECNNYTSSSPKPYLEELVHFMNQLKIRYQSVKLISFNDDCMDDHWQLKLEIPLPQSQASNF